MDARVEQLAAELAAIQRRRGLQSATWAATLGPLLTQALALDQHPQGEARREALVAGLLQHVEVLPPDMRFVFLAACSLRTKHKPYLGERLEAAGEAIEVNVRTTWRRLHDANLRLAEHLVAALDANRPAPPSEWVLTALRVSTDLSVARPVFRSTHTVRVVSPYLSEITERISFPGAEPDADPEFAVSGACSLVSVERAFQVTWVLTMRLSRTLACGQSATYSMVTKAPSRRLVHPMSVMLPERECRTFATEVNFGTPSAASQVWRLDGVPAPVAELDEPSGPLLDSVANPVLRAEYTNMVRGRVYGLRWQWSENQPQGND